MSKSKDSRSESKKKPLKSLKKNAQLKRKSKVKSKIDDKWWANRYAVLSTLLLLCSHFLSTQKNNVRKALLNHANYHKY